MVSVTIGGYTPEAVYDVQDGQNGGGQLAKAIIQCGATPGNRSNINDGDEVVITRNGETTYTGYVMGRPSKGRDGTLKVEAMDKRLELKHVQVNRTFNNVDSGEVVQQAVDYEAIPLDRREAFFADNLSNWESDAPILELYTDVPSSSNDTETTPLWEYGGDMVFVGFRKGASGDFYVRQTNVSSDITIGLNGGLQKAMTRILINNQGQQFEVEFELRDSFGRNFVWDLPLRGSDFQEYELEAADADPDGELGNDLTAEYRISINGTLNENRGMFIDAAHTVPYYTSDRNTGITTNNVRTTGRKVTRRVDQSAMELIQDLAQEDRHDFWIDASDDLHYEPSGGESRPNRDIIEGQTAVTSADFDRNAEQVSNKVIVQGAGDIQVTVRNPASIQFYGVAPRSEPIVDKNIQTRDEAEKRGRGYLAENAWNGSVASFEIADAAYKDVGVGDTLYVRWPSQDIDGDFVVRDREVNSAGIVNLSMGVSIRG